MYLLSMTKFKLSRKTHSFGGCAWALGARVPRSTVPCSVAPRDAPSGTPASGMCTIWRSEARLGTWPVVHVGKQPLPAAGHRHVAARAHGQPLGAQGHTIWHHRPASGGGGGGCCPWPASGDSAPMERRVGPSGWAHSSRAAALCFLTASPGQSLSGRCHHAEPLVEKNRADSSINI